MITLALVGVGKWGQNFLKTASQLDNCKIKYVCSRNQNTLNSLSDEYIKTTSIDDLIESTADGIIIATPASTHFEIAKKLLEHNFNLLIEKPLATNFSQALELQNISLTKKAKILVGHTYLYNPAFIECKKLLKRIGAIQSIHFEGRLSPRRDDISVVWDWGPHAISIMLNLIDTPIKNISVLSDHKSQGKLDSLKTELIFNNDIRGLIDIAWSGSEKVRKLTIKGNNGRVVLDDTNQEGQKITFYGSNQVIHPQYGPEASLTNELNEFVGSLIDNRKITSDINLGVSVVKVLSDIEKLL